MRTKGGWGRGIERRGLLDANCMRVSCLVRTGSQWRMERRSTSLRSGSSEVGVDMGKIWQNIKICKEKKW